MCEPISITLGTVAALTAVTGAVAAYQQGENANKLAKKQAEYETENRTKDYLNQVQALTVQQSQVGEKSQAEVSERQAEARRERARLRTAMGEAGLGGSISEGRLMQASMFDESQDVSTIEGNREKQVEELEYQKSSARLKAQGPGLFINQPSIGLAIAQAGLGIAGGAAQGGAHYQKVK